MIIVPRVRSTEVVFDFVFDPDDRLEVRKAKPAQRTCTIWLPHRVRGIHPDLVCLAGLLIAFPWIKKTARFEGDCRPSHAFAHTLQECFGYRVEGADGSVTARPLNPRGRAGLSFSAGVDSVAALLLMPNDTVGFYLRRVTSDRVVPESNYRSDFAMHAIGELRRQGRDILSVDSDLEFTRRPTGVPVDWANAVPALLLADEYNVRSIAWGLVLESAYCIGTAPFQDWLRRPVARNWGKVFAAAGVPMSPVVAGLSEVCTSTIVSKSRYADLAQSCVRGTVDKPCGSCPKCFRKSLLEAALGVRAYDSIDFDHYFAIEEVQRVLLESPIKHQNVLAYSMMGYAGSNNIAVTLRQRLLGGTSSGCAFGRYYAPYLDSLPEFERAEVEARLREYLEPMSKDEESALQSWSYDAGAEDVSQMRAHFDAL